jgi:hypothetical protein
MKVGAGPSSSGDQRNNSNNNNNNNERKRNHNSLTTEELRNKVSQDIATWEEAPPILTQTSIDELSNRV